MVVFYSGSNLECLLRLLKESGVEFRLESKLFIALGAKAFNQMCRLGVPVSLSQVRVCCTPSLAEVIRQIQSFNE